MAGKDFYRSRKWLVTRTETYLVEEKSRELAIDAIREGWHTDSPIETDYTAEDVEKPQDRRRPR